MPSFSIGFGESTWCDMDDLQHSFDLLQLKPGATPAEVKRAFRDQVAAWHPDRFASDPAMQRRAEERLRLVIEAHRSIMAYHGAHASGGGAASQFAADDDRRGSPGAVWTFFRSAPNLVFCAAVLGCGLLASSRFGISVHAWTYGLEMALVPALFSLAYNLTSRRSAVVRNLYLCFSFCALAVVVVECAMMGVEGTAPAGEQEIFVPTGHYGGAVGSGWSLPRGGGIGPVGDGLSPAPPGPPAPRAPMLPLAPAAPAAPLAPAAPVAPLAR